MKIKTEEIAPLFPPHKVKIKSIYDGFRYPSPSQALEYIMARFPDVDIIINKQHTTSLTIILRCGSIQYKLIKLHFVKDMGKNFIWKDRTVDR